MNVVWLVLGEDRVLVNIGSVNEVHFRELGYAEEGAARQDLQVIKKRRAKAES